LQDDLQDFLTIAEELEIKGLAGVPNIGLVPSNKSEYKQVRQYGGNSSVHNATKSDNEYDIASKKSEVGLKKSYDDVVPNSERSVDIASNTDFSIFDEQINLIIEKTDAGFQCNLCRYVSRQMGHIKEHVENIHLGGIPVACTECGTICKSRQKLRYHRKKEHCKTEEEAEAEELEIKDLAGVPNIREVRSENSEYQHVRQYEGNSSVQNVKKIDNMK